MSECCIDEYTQTDPEELKNWGFKNGIPIILDVSYQVDVSTKEDNDDED